MTEESSRPQEVAVWVSEILGQAVDPNNGSANLIEDYGANSMDVVDIVEKIERLYGVTITNDQIPGVRTFSDLLNLIPAKE